MQSRQAYEDGDGAAAKELSNEGKAHAARMDDYNQQASDFIFRENNADGRVEPDAVDLHGQFVEEAERILEERIRADQARGQAHLVAIVGKGNHSSGGVQRIKPKVEELCQELGLQYRTDEDNVGRIIINLQGGEPLPPHEGGGYSGHHGGHQQQQQQPQQQENDQVGQFVEKQLPWLLQKLEKHCCVVM